MAFDVYTENQIHERAYCGSAAGQWLLELAPEAETGGVLSMVGVYGDTMFNIQQMHRLLNELAEIGHRKPELRKEVNEMGRIIEGAIRKRGYLWISGD